MFLKDLNAKPLRGRTGVEKINPYIFKMENLGVKLIYTQIFQLKLYYLPRLRIQMKIEIIKSIPGRIHVISTCHVPIFASFR